MLSKKPTIRRLKAPHVKGLWRGCTLASWMVPQTQKATGLETVPPGSHLDGPISQQGNNDFVIRPGDSQFQVCNILVSKHLDWIGLLGSPGRSRWGWRIPITQDSPQSLREGFLGRTTKADHIGDWRDQKWNRPTKIFTRCIRRLPSFLKDDMGQHGAHWAMLPWNQTNCVLSTSISFPTASLYTHARTRSHTLKLP